MKFDLIDSVKMLDGIVRELPTKKCNSRKLFSYFPHPLKY